MSQDDPQKPDKDDAHPSQKEDAATPVDDPTDAPGNASSPDSKPQAADAEPRPERDDDARDDDARDDDEDAELSGQHSTPAPADVAAKPDAAAPSTSQARSTWLIALAALVSVVSLVAPISRSGIWDPHELTVAELARRIALNLLGGSQLVVEGANNTLPTLGDLARGQLPFTSVALGFRLFGLHEWAGRLPLALWGLVGIFAIYALVARLADRRAGAFAALALATMPLYFLQARTILGDIVTMSAIALATAGLGIAVFDRPDPGESTKRRITRRILWGVLGLLGVAAAFGARGALIGVVVPALGVGSAWLLSRLAGASKSGEALGDVFGALALTAGLAALYIGGRALGRNIDDPKQFSMLVGAAVNPQRQLPTFDFVIHYLGHGLFPWSALIPFALGRMFARPLVSDSVAEERETRLRLLCVTVPVVGFGIYALMAPYTGHLAFGPVALFAVIVALALRDFDRGAPGSRTMAMGVAAFAILFYMDFKEFPEKGLSAFAVDNAKFPESFKESAHSLLKYGTLCFVGVFFLSFMERENSPSFRPDEHRLWPKTLRTVWNGNLWFLVIVAEVALIGFALLTQLSDRVFHWKQFAIMGSGPRNVAKLGWAALPALVVAPSLALVARDAARKLFELVPVSRAFASLLGVVVCGSILSLGYYPALAAQISPKEVFEAYQSKAKAGEKLGLLGVGSGTATYYAGSNTPSFTAAITAFNWMMEGKERRWLVIRQDDLPQINSLYRNQAKPLSNLPVLDARSSEILLVSNRLESGEQNQNPFDGMVLNQKPEPKNRVDANFGGQLEALGWEVRTPDGNAVDSVVPGRPYQFVIFYEVKAPISGNWETFIHIDGFQRRYNGDHKTLDGKYPFHLWRVGDYIADIHNFTLEPNFTAGAYNVFYGLFIGSRRLDVKRGRHDDNRLIAGRLNVR